MEQRFLIDTNIIIDAQMQILPKEGMQFLANIINSNFTVSFITYIEFLGYRNLKKSSEEFIALANIIEINSFIINECIQLRKLYNIKLPDAIIASTAISLDLTLITRNIKDFQTINGLKIINPYTI
jgi:predicted nucleic acid-binding protein